MRVWQVTAAAAAALVLAVPEGLDSCSIAPPTPVFATSRRPADLRNSFLAGKVGVLQRSYQPRYLIGAFRILSGVPLTDAEVSSLYSPSDDQRGADFGSIAARWIQARGLGAVETYKTVTLEGRIHSFANCHEDAFFRAAETLKKLSETWGAQDPRTEDWARAQDQVFANCAGRDATIPAALAAGADALLAAHRRYQIAAALFYSGQHRQSAEAFRQIAVEKDSPWRDWGSYLTARALLRGGLFDGDLAAFREGKDLLLAILKDPAQADRHDDCLALLHLWQVRVEPRARLAELSAKLMHPNSDGVRQEVIDFLYLMDRSKPETVDPAGELTAWMLAMSERPPADAGQRAVEWWRKSHNAAWLIAALANSPEKDLPELLATARRIPPGAPAFDSATYYAASREIARGRNDEARRWADRALSTPLQRSSRNWILALRTRVARDWSEFLKFGLRRPEPHIELFEDAEIETESAPIPTGNAPVFDWDVIRDFNARVPLALWVDAAANPILPPHMQLRIAQSGWARAVVLGRYEEARKLMQRIAETQPAAADAARGFLTARDDGEARIAALYVVLRSPSLRPELVAPEMRAENLARAHYMAADPYGRRTGCWSYFPPGGSAPQRSTMNSGFLAAAQRAAGEAEWQQFRKAAPWDATWLARETLDWARKQPDDPRVPEALHRAVMASRWRCIDAATGKYSKAAFQLLHQRYAKSEWAAKTKYWYR